MAKQISINIASSFTDLILVAKPKNDNIKISETMTSEKNWCNEFVYILVNNHCIELNIKNILELRKSIMLAVDRSVIVEKKVLI